MRSAIIQLKSFGIQPLSLHSGQLNKFTAFVALQGAKHHGLTFVDQAIQAHAPCVILDEKDSFASSHIQVIKIPQLTEQLGNLIT